MRRLPKRDKNGRFVKGNPSPSKNRRRKNTSSKRRSRRGTKGRKRSNRRLPGRDAKGRFVRANPPKYSTATRTSLRRSAAHRKRDELGRFVEGNPGTEVLLLNPDLVALGKSAAAHTAGIVGGMALGSSVNWALDRAGAPPRSQTVKALITAGSCAAVGAGAHYAGAPNVRNGALVTSMAVAILAGLRKLSYSGGRATTYLGPFLNRTGLSGVSHGAALLTDDMGQVYSRGGTRTVKKYGLDRLAAGPEWQILLPDGSEVNGRLEGLARTDDGDEAYQIREESTGEVLLLPVHVTEEVGGQPQARPLAGVVERGTREGLSGVVERGTREGLSGVVERGTREGLSGTGWDDYGIGEEGWLD